jgi:hypothetical protein
MKKIMIGIIIMLVLAGIASAEFFEENYTSPFGSYYTSEGNTILSVISMKYKPYPANPGEYITLWVKAENFGTELTENAVFELMPEYPFSLDSNENPIKEYGKIASEPVVMEYDIRVDKDAVEGANELKLRYKGGPKEDWDTKTFKITVEDAQTDFDVVIQETSDGEISLALANTGKNVAYSVIVRIPEQESFKAVGTNGQMVGNLEDGDYTLVGFEITSKARQGNEPLKIQIDYTDEIGERRSVVKEVDYNDGMQPQSAKGDEIIDLEALRNSRRQSMQTDTAIYQKWWFWAVVIVLAYAGFRGYKLHKEKKQKREEKKAKK